ncbi:MAG TPA: Rrf2 family transcriptional regulator [Usitatibacter sp.]|nr:Rrf2 family transcriptional regulator [Usitatibacter sp.]
MKLTTFTDYTLRTLIYVAASPSGRCTIAQVAAAFGISETHLVKVAHELGRQGLLRNTRGRGGGLSLAVPAASINLGDVVRAAEGEDRLAECFTEGGRCAIAGRCRLETALKEASSAFYEVLARYTLADLTSNSRALARALRWEPLPLRH